MKRKLIRSLEFLLLSIVLIFCLCNTQISMKAAQRGLLQWYQTILPVLFPFMILTTLFRYLHFDTMLCKRLKILFFPFSQISSAGHFIILFGFLCGFPMGAKLVSEAYQNNKISKAEANLLLGFCNNISPAFLLGIVYPVTQIILINCPFKWLHTKTPYILCMYGVPYLYGFILQFFMPKYQLSQSKKIVSSKVENNETLIKLLDMSFQENILPIVKLGGYMMLFQMISFIPITLLNFMKPETSLPLPVIISSLLEITNGTLLFANCHIYKVPDQFPAISIGMLFFFLHFGGLSCIMQTNSFICKTDLPISKYILQKCILGTLSFFFFMLLAFIASIL